MRVQCASHTTASPDSDRAARGRVVSVAGVAFLFLICAGCGTTHAQLSGFLRSHDLGEATGEYVVLPPDEVQIHAPTAPEIDGVTQRVRPDGKIVLRLLGEVHVSGLTTRQIANKLEAQLARYYQAPEVVVAVTAYRSQHYFVFGEVYSPGRRPFTGRDTLLKALADARPTFLAWQSQIRVVRPSADGEQRKIITVDLERIIRRGELDQNILLLPGDVIEVPPTPLAWLGLRVRELLYPVEPVVRAYAAPADIIDDSVTYRRNSDGSYD